MFAHARVSIPVVMAVLLAIGEPVFGQRGGVSPGGTPSNNPGTGTSPGGIGRNSPTTTQPQPLAPVFLNGRVMLEDSSAPQGRVAIVMLCTGRQRVLGYADLKGYFSVQLGSPSPEVVDDASVGGIRGNGQLPAAAESTNSRNTGDRDLIGCELHGQLAGYDSQSLELGMRERLDNPNVGTILMRRLGADEGSVVSATTLAAPKDAKKAYEKGLDAEKKKKLPDAQASLEKAVAAYPKYALAWAELGKVQAAQGQAETARNSLKQSITADPKFVPPYVEMSQLEYRAHEWQPLADTTEKATALDPFHYPLTFFLNAVANYNLHNLDRAEESLRKAQKLDVNHQIPQTSYLLGMILAERKNFTAAAEQVAEYLRLAPNASDAAEARSQLGRLEDQAKANPGAPQQ